MESFGFCSAESPLMDIFQENVQRDPLASDSGMESFGFCSEANEESPLTDVFQENLQQYQLTRNWRKEFRQELRKHIADNVKKGLYQLMPLLNRQCRFCRAVNIHYFQQHEEQCQKTTHVFGCPCGFLCSSTKCLGGHSRACEIAQSIKRQGDSGWIPYVTYDFKQKFLST